LPRPRPVSEARDRIERELPETVGFSVKRFVYSLWKLPLSTPSSESVPSEDLIFAFQEKLCAIIEIEIESDDGVRSPIFASKLNRFLCLSDTRESEPVPLDVAESSTSIDFVSPTSIDDLLPQKVEEDSPKQESNDSSAEVDHEVLFNVSVQELRFAFGSAETEPPVVMECQDAPASLSAVLIRVDSDDSD
jgi:hypothetical protein